MDKIRHSEMWRETRHKDEAKEIAVVTQGVTDYLGTVAGDRTYKVRWEPMNGIAQTSGEDKVITINPGILKDATAPYSDEFVDYLSGIAAHEAGHTILMPKLDKPTTALGAAVWNIIQDIAIDYGPERAENEGIWELTQGVRDSMAEEQRKLISDQWNGSEPLTKEDFVNCWGCSVLFKCEDVLTDIPQRQAEAALLPKLKPLSDYIRDLDTKLSDSRTAVTVARIITEVLAILASYQPTPQLDSPGESGEGDGEADGEGTEGEGADGSSDGDAEGDDKTGSGEAGPKGPGSKPGKGSESKDSEDSDDKPTGVFNPNKPMACPNHDAAKPKIDRWFWKDATRELMKLEAASNLAKGQARTRAKQALRPFIDDKIVNQVLKAYMDLASEPSRRRREETGRIDRKRILWAEGRDDMFTRQLDTKLDGTLVLLLDFSGSVEEDPPVFHLTKQLGASVYTALSRTEVRPYVYVYGDGVQQIASPTKVGDWVNASDGGGTGTAEGFGTILAEVPKSGQSVIVHVTDGGADEPALALQQMLKAKAEGWSVINILVGQYAPDWRNEPYFGNTEAPFIVLKRYQELPKVIAEAVKAIVKKGRGL